LIACNSLLLDFGRCLGVSHQLGHLLLDTESLQKFFTVMVESAELSEVETGDRLDSVIFSRETLVNNHVNQMKIFLLIKINAVFLPELFGVAWSPSKLSSVNLVSELLDGAEYLLVLVEILEKVVQHLVDIIINPMSVLQLDD
jgi:hypothetical protein